MTKTVNPGPRDVGFVAPDPTDGTHFNTLVLRRPYRISLRVGDLDELFPDPINTNRGRAARLNAVGLFYRTLDEPKMEECLLENWKYFRESMHKPPLTNEKAEEKLKEWLNSHILAKLPEEGKFEKIHLPGGFSVDQPWANTGLYPDYNAAHSLGGDHFAVETEYYTANDVMGKIPLLVKVERYDVKRGWLPAPGAMVYFQLQMPDDLPPFDPAKPCAEQLNRPPLRESLQGPATGAPATANGAGPKLYSDTHITNYLVDNNPDPALRDPQANNVHVDKGGKRGTPGSAAAGPVGGVIFEIKSRPGFHTPHPGRKMSHGELNVAVPAAPDGNDHKHAVRVAANDEGEAGVIFMPSRCGGDRYKLRVYVGPPTLDSNGADDQAVAITTGTMVVWRTIRLSRYIFRKDPAMANFPAAIEAAYAGPPYNLNKETIYLRCGLIKQDLTYVGMKQADMTPTGLRDNGPVGAGNWEGPARQYAKAWCEFIIDPNVAIPEEPDAATQRAAFDAGVAYAKNFQGAMGVNWDLDKLFFFDARTPFTINIREPAEYDALPGVTPAQKIGPIPPAAGNDPRDTMSMVLNEFLNGMLSYYSKKGSLPGLTFIQYPMGCIWDVTSGALRGPTNGPHMTSGVSLHFRGAYLWYGERIYSNQPSFPYNVSSNTCHELGHSLYAVHQPSPFGGGIAARHDAADWCVMSYNFCEGQYCGKTLALLQGLDIAKF
ncbi:MAG TPA: hypothetical protein PK847_07305 [Candidatus Sumerlaeota bacterium]|nr:hypothetical protein [Candidatus Sumerlaeota bacterium]